MAEKCPLRKGDIHWESGTGMAIPDICFESCQERWMDAAYEAPLSIDTFPHNEGAEHPDAGIEYSDSSLQVGPGKIRFYSVLNECIDCGGEDCSETYQFVCPIAPDQDTLPLW